MNDDQLRSELERRADSASPRPDWTKRVLLPALWREVDARPQPVVRARLSPKWSVAAAVVALLVLIVAVPRLVSQPSSASPSPGIPEVLSTSDFVTQLAAHRLSGRSVLVNGSMVAYDGPPIFGPVCGGPGPACMVGQLDGTQPRVVVYSRDIAVGSGADSTTNSNPGWPWWERPTPPIDGTLLLSVSNAGGVEFNGLVQLNGPNLTWSATQASGVNATDAGLYDVLLVDGWLTGIDAPIPCPQGDHVEGLPTHADCGRNAWLVDRPATLNPYNYSVPSGALLVQTDAFDDFAPQTGLRDGQSVVPQRGVYAVTRRLFGDGCGGNPPCWGWAIVARVDSLNDATQSEPSPSNPVIDCSGGDVAGTPPVSLRDHTGSVIACSARFEADEVAEAVSVSNPEGDPNQLVVTFSDFACALTMDFWAPPPGGALGEQSRPDHVLQIDSSAPCIPHSRGVTSGSVVLTLNTPVAASNVNAFITTGSAATNTVETHGNRFALTLSTDFATNVAGAPIAATATANYLGPEPTTVSPYNFGFGFEQLDGTLEMHPVSELVGQIGCHLQHLNPGDMADRAYSKSGSWSNEDPNSAFYKEYIRDPELHLPPGTYRVFAYLSFANESCGGEPVSVLTSIVVHVAPGGSPTPEPTPAPIPSATPEGARFDCPPTTPDFGVPYGTLHSAVVDQTGLVLGCDVPQHSMFDWTDDHPLQIGNPNGDLNVLQIEWDGDPCDAARAYTLQRDGDQFALRGIGTYSGMCILPRVIHAIRLELSDPIEASSIVFTWEGSVSSMPLPTPAEPNGNTFVCRGSEALGDPGVVLLDHSGRIAGCSMATAGSVPNRPLEPIEVSDAGFPNQLAVTWTYNASCPADEQLDFWGPIAKPIGFAEDVLQLARTHQNQFGPAICSDVVSTRQVVISFVDPVQPSDILAIAVDKDEANNTVSGVRSATVSGGTFDLLLQAPLQGLLPNVPLDIKSTLTYRGPNDSVTLTGLTRPDFIFASLTGGPILSAYGNDLMCPQDRPVLSPGGTIDGSVVRPPEVLDGDPNKAYYDEYMADGQFRLPEGSYLILNAVSFAVGDGCAGASVQMRDGIVITIHH